MTPPLCPAAIGAGAGDRGAAATGGLPEHDPGPQPPGHGAQCTLHWGGVPGGVTPAPQQGVAGRQQTSQRRPAQRSAEMGWCLQTKKLLSVQLQNKYNVSERSRQTEDTHFGEEKKKRQSDNHEHTMKERETFHLHRCAIAVFPARSAWSWLQ